jgi:peptidoglycan/xylan/chitin deacetylase (PgdA/CDA1 family)
MLNTMRRKTRGAISLVFDDGYTSVFNDVVPLLNHYDLPGVFALPITAAADLDGQPITPWDQWLPLRARGHELAAHSRGHVDLTTLSENELQRELQEPQEKLGAHTVVYPGGAHNASVIEQTRLYYQAGRTVKRGFENLVPKNPYALHSFNYTRDNFSLLRANARVLWAWLTGKWLIETYHVVDNALPVVHSVRLQDFERHLTFIHRLPIAVKTIRGVVSHL